MNNNYPPSNPNNQFNDQYNPNGRFNNNYDNYNGNDNYNNNNFNSSNGYNNFGGSNGNSQNTNGQSNNFSNMANMNFNNFAMLAQKMLQATMQSNSFGGQSGFMGGNEPMGNDSMGGYTNDGQYTNGSRNGAAPAAPFMPPINPALGQPNSNGNGFNQRRGPNNGFMPGNRPQNFANDEFDGELNRLLTLNFFFIS